MLFAVPAAQVVIITGTCPLWRGNEIGSWPEGLTSPNNAFATALPLNIPPLNAQTGAFVERFVNPAPECVAPRHKTGRTSSVARQPPFPLAVTRPISATNSLSHTHDTASCEGIIVACLFSPCLWFARRVQSASRCTLARVVAQNVRKRTHALRPSERCSRGGIANGI